MIDSRQTDKRSTKTAKIQRFKAIIFRLPFTVYRSPRHSFTLAEVLITLGIIGVVAAYTIPILMQNIQDQQFKEAAKEAYSKASQAIQQMKNDNGGSLSTYTNSYTNFKTPFMAYFKIIDPCTSTCVPVTSESTIYKTLYRNPAKTSWMGGQFVTTDGMFWATYSSGSYIFITVDVNGYINPPNIYGKDTFFFQLSDDRLFPLGANGTNRTAPDYCDRTHDIQSLMGVGCMTYVMQGKDY